MDRELILAHDPLFFYAPQPGLDTGKGLVFRNGFTDGLVMGEEPVPAVHDLALQLWIEVMRSLSLRIPYSRSVWRNSFSSFSVFPI